MLDWHRWVLGLLIFLGAHSVVLFALWWFRIEHVLNPILFTLLSLATWYGVLRIMVGWYNGWSVEQPEFVPAPEGLSVAIFITASPGEPPEMFDRTLAAVAEISYPHTTYLLDDSLSREIASIAERHGAVRLEIVGVPGAKAGKINEALERTSEEFILVLDPDHIPLPMFLDRVLGYFENPKVGFVQVSQAYHNAGESFVARGAAEQTFMFYGPIMQGMHGNGTAVAIGANCTFRRSALESIGGHGIGLAEDLVTSIRLHAKGWESVYVPEIVSRGLVPADIDSFTKQQLKWSRGVHEVLLIEYPRAFRGLTWHQRIVYLMIGTYYLVGFMSFVYMLIPILYLWTGRQPAAMLLGSYARHALPVGIFGVLIYRFMQRWLCDPGRERGFHWRGTLLKLGLWNVHLYGLVLAILRVDVPYIPTAKKRGTSRFLRTARIPLAISSICLVTICWTIWQRLFVLAEAQVRITTEVTATMVLFLLIDMIYQSGRLWAAWVDRDRQTFR